MRHAWVGVLLAGLAACVPRSAASRPTLGTERTPRDRAAPLISVALRSPLREDPQVPAPELDARALVLPPPPPGLAPPPARCASFLAHGTEAVRRKSCGLSARGPLVAALEVPDPEGRDAALAPLEACEELPPGLVRALRAELAPVVCADALVGPLWTAQGGDGVEGVSAPLRLAYVGLGLAARLARTVEPPPAPPVDLDLSGFQAYLKSALRPWLLVQAQAIQALSFAGSSLPGYGKGLVALQAAQADLRLVVAVRESPLPSELVADAEFRSLYDPALEQALEPRKVRGRDAGLVALGIFAHLGGLEEPRVLEVRRLLTQVYGGRPLDALDPLLLPPLAEPSPGSSPAARLARLLPSYYAPLVLSPEEVHLPDVLEGLVVRGLSPEHRSELARGSLDAAAHRKLSIARFRSAQRSWRALDVDRALAHALAAQELEPSEEGRGLVALGLALRDGPEDASDVLLRAPTQPLGLGHTEALDALAAEGGSLSAVALFNAALLRQWAAPPEPDRSYWSDVARRWEAAARSALRPEQRAYAEDRAAAANQLVQSLP